MVPFTSIHFATMNMAATVMTPELEKPAQADTFEIARKNNNTPLRGSSASACARHVNCDSMQC